MSSVGITMIVLAVGTYALKAAGPLALGSRPLPPRFERITRELPVALLAALVVTMTVTTDGRWVLDARVPGVAAAAVALLRRLPFFAVVVTAGAVTALARVLT